MMSRPSAPVVRGSRTSTGTPPAALAVPVPVVPLVDELLPDPPLGALPVGALPVDAPLLDDDEPLDAADPAGFGAVRAGGVGGTGAGFAGWAS
jgi:hypothetical protein